MARIEDIKLNSSTGNYEDRYGQAFHDFINSNGLKINFTLEKNNVPRYKDIKGSKQIVTEP